MRFKTVVRLSTFGLVISVLSVVMIASEVALILPMVKFYMKALDVFN